jgi:hypothetical protein
MTAELDQKQPKRLEIEDSSYTVGTLFPSTLRIHELHIHRNPEKDLSKVDEKDTLQPS